MPAPLRWAAQNPPTNISAHLFFAQPEYPGPSLLVTVQHTKAMIKLKGGKM